MQKNNTFSKFLALPHKAIMGHMFEERDKHVHYLSIYLVDEKIQNYFEWDMFYERDKQVISLIQCLCSINAVRYSVLGTSDISWEFT